jgi:hypothetical protein
MFRRLGDWFAQLILHAFVTVAEVADAIDRSRRVPRWRG